VGAYGGFAAKPFDLRLHPVAKVSIWQAKENEFHSEEEGINHRNSSCGPLSASAGLPAKKLGRLRQEVGFLQEAGPEWGERREQSASSAEFKPRRNIHHTE